MSAILELLPIFAPDDWKSVAAAFDRIEKYELDQAWLDAPETAFRPATARLGWRNESLWIYAILHDDDIFNSATAPNQAMWTTGDVFETFLRPPGQKTYFEFHVTPENQTLQLRFPDENALGAGQKWSDFIVPEPLFSSRTGLENGQWRVLIEIPAANVVENPALEAAREWKFSLSRYDATRGQNEAVLSSTSPHQVPRFHRQHEWRHFAIPTLQNQESP